MERIEYDLYQIDQNKHLIDEAKKVLEAPLPTSYYNKSDDFFVVRDILHRIIEDRSKKIDEVNKDFIGGRDLNSIAGQTWTIRLDKETEETIEKLFDREKKIIDIQPNGGTLQNKI